MQARTVILGPCLLVLATLVACACSRGPSSDGAAATPAAGTPAVPATPAETPVPTGQSSGMERIVKTEEEWRKQLTPEQFHVLREKGTERAFTGEHWKTTGGGEWRCAGCGNVLFRGTDKFVSECGWPAFDKAIKGSIAYHTDSTFGMMRTEVTCHRCGGHLGHVFDDGPPETTGVRYCINSVSITYHPDVQPAKDVQTEARVEAEK